MNLLHKKSNVFWIVFNASIIGVAGILLACTDFSEDELYYLSNFAPEAVVDNEFKPFFYTSLTFYNVNHDLGHIDLFRQINIDEWYDYLT